MNYVILGQLSGIGGWQLYIEARAKHLSDNGHEVYLISIGSENEIKLSTFLEFKHFCIPELHMPPSSYTKRQCGIILKKVYSFLGIFEDIDMLIESTDMYLSMWGEIIAQRYQARNYSYLLHSHFPQQNRFVQDFFLYKYDRNELAGMSELTLPELFNNNPRQKSIVPRNLPAAPRDPLTSNNPITDITDAIEKYKDKERAFVICYFGNLDKPHFLLLCDFIQDYSKQNENKKFMFVSIGSSGNGIPEKKQKKLDSIVKNCNTLNIPSIYPVPIKLFQIMDVCIASWGSSDTSARAGALTIRLLDDVTIIPQGIVGITVNDYKSPRCKETISQLLDKIIMGEFVKDNILINYDKNDYHQAHKKIDIFVFNKENSKEYYNISEIKYVSKRSRIEKILNMIFGIKLTRSIIKIIKRLFFKSYAMIQRKESYAN